LNQYEFEPFYTSPLPVYWLNSHSCLLTPSSTLLAASSGSASISAPICLQNLLSLIVLLQSPQSCSTVLEEDAEFPATKAELIEKQGWKVFDLTETEHVHAGVLLQKLPERKFTGVEKVIGALYKETLET
jgi:hypothetical protein